MSLMTLQCCARGRRRLGARNGKRVAASKIGCKCQCQCPSCCTTDNIPVGSRPSPDFRTGLMALLVTSPGDSLQLCRVQCRKFRAKCCHLKNRVVNEAPFYTFSYHGQVLTCLPPSSVQRYLTSLLHPDDTVPHRHIPYGWSVREVLRPALVLRCSSRVQILDCDHDQLWSRVVLSGSDKMRRF